MFHALISKRTLGRLLRVTGIDALLVRVVNGKRPSIIVYHDPNPLMFKEILAYIQRHYSIVSIDRLVKSLRSGQLKSLPSRAIAITLDDGHNGNFALAAILKGIDAETTIYLCSQIAGTERGFWWSALDDPEPLKLISNNARLAALRDLGFYEDHDMGSEHRQALSKHEIRIMSEFVDFGAHTRFHPILPMCDELTARAEIDLAVSEVEELSGQPCQHFAYPNGDVSERDRVLVQESGYESARTVNPGWVRPSTDSFMLPIVSMDEVVVDRLVVDLSGIGVLKRSVVSWIRRSRKRKGSQGRSWWMRSGD